MNTDSKNRHPRSPMFADVLAFRRLDRSDRERRACARPGLDRSVGPFGTRHRPAAAMVWPEHRRRDGAGGCAGARISQWQPDADVDRDVWPDRHYGAACASAGCGWRHHGMEEQSVASLSAPDQGSRCADRFGVSVGDQHASGPSRACRAVRRGGRQGHGEPGVAQGADRLGRLECTTPERRADCAADPHGTVVRVRLDKKATAMSLLVVIGVREDG